VPLFLKLPCCALPKPSPEFYTGFDVYRGGPELIRQGIWMPAFRPINKDYKDRRVQPNGMRCVDWLHAKNTV
jgi:hypothetical protein